MQAAGGAPLTTQNPNRPRVLVLLGVAAFVITADAISKAIAVAHIREYTYIHLIGSLLMLTLTRNGGAAFNLGGTGMTIVFTAIAAGVVIYILRAARSLRSTGWAITLGLLLGGATGNLIDRIFRAPGFLRGDVIDWIELPHWPVFNVADSSIVCAGVLVVLLSMRGIRLDGTRIGPQPNPPTPTPTPTQTQTPTQTPIQPPAQTPTPTRTPAQTQTPIQPPAQTQTPIQPPAQTPTRTPAQTPIQPPAQTQTPARTPTQTPTRTPTPTQTPTRTVPQTQTPTRTPPQTPTLDTPESDYPKLDYPEPHSSAAKSHDGT